MKWITEEDLENISIGATLLGTGGGGDPFVGRLMALQAIQKYGPVKVLQLEELDDDALVMPVGAIGAPSVSNEKIASEEEIYGPAEVLKETFPERTQAIMPIEIGGGNSLLPIACAAKMGLPIVDADAMGRAFPESQMVTFFLKGYQPEIVAMADSQGNRVIFYPKDGEWSEKIARSITDVMGGSANMVDNVFPGKVVKECAIRGTLSLARQIGAELTNMKETTAPVERLLTRLNGFSLFEGKINHIERNVEGGFTRGRATMTGISRNKGEELELLFQNELLLAKKDGQVVASTPDLICALDYETGRPITTETLRYGARIHVIALPCDPKWRTEKGIEVAGPRYFGYQVDYQPVEELMGEKAYVL
ncbi:hypothetical protein BAU15_02510 [Enterococcus sp. JM4C]|uniref:DUF917 domain-containing protein n=1 Tax=Candidatus Enterococcus huntleyi TaxID=1857217 RepID=UPI00137A6EDA|nr:DUF917 domain-containing protein [Enterococcus sp. JM4C]KAF1299534.1 hypothetical protein BAU15_02510 [Enterococcus sp. JM4C]